MKIYYQDELVKVESGLSIKGDVEVLGRVLKQINIAVAKSFCREPKEITVEFSPVIRSRNQRRLALCVGTCDHITNHIQLVNRQGWQNTYIHELAHLYKPTATEARIYIIANDLVKYLKYIAISI